MTYITLAGTIDQVTITHVTATKIIGGYRYDAVHGDGTVEVIRKKAARLYERAYYYSRPVTGSNKRGLALVFTFGLKPVSSHADCVLATYTVTRRVEEGGAA